MFAVVRKRPWPANEILGTVWVRPICSSSKCRLNEGQVDFFESSSGTMHSLVEGSLQPGDMGRFPAPYREQPFSPPTWNCRGGGVTSILWSARSGEPVPHWQARDWRCPPAYCGQRFCANRRGTVTHAKNLTSDQVRQNDQRSLAPGVA